MTGGTAGRGSRDLRQTLIDTASAMLQESRPAPAPSLRAVARACNVSATAVYLHFDSWSALIDAVLEQHFNDVRAQVEAALRAAGQPRQRIDAFAFAYVEWGLSNPGPVQLLFESVEWIKNTDAVHSWLEECMESVADDFLAIGSAHGRAQAMERVSQLMIALQGIIMTRRQKGRHAEQRSVADEVASMVRVFVGESVAPTAE